MYIYFRLNSYNNIPMRIIQKNIYQLTNTYIRKTIRKGQLSYNIW